MNRSIVPPPCSLLDHGLHDLALHRLQTFAEPEPTPASAETNLAETPTASSQAGPLLQLLEQRLRLALLSHYCTPGQLQPGKALQAWGWADGEAGKQAPALPLAPVHQLMLARCLCEGCSDVGRLQLAWGQLMAPLLASGSADSTNHSQLLEQALSAALAASVQLGETSITTAIVDMLIHGRMDGTSAGAAAASSSGSGPRLQALSPGLLVQLLGLLWAQRSQYEPALVADAAAAVVVKRVDPALLAALVPRLDLLTDLDLADQLVGMGQAVVQAAQQAGQETPNMGALLDAIALRCCEQGQLQHLEQQLPAWLAEYPGYAPSEAVCSALLSKLGVKPTVGLMLPEGSDLGSSEKAQGLLQALLQAGSPEGLEAAADVLKRAGAAQAVQPELSAAAISTGAGASSDKGQQLALAGLAALLAHPEAQGLPPGAAGALVIACAAQPSSLLPAVLSALGTASSAAAAHLVCCAMLQAAAVQCSTGAPITGEGALGVMQQLLQLAGQLGAIPADTLVAVLSASLLTVESSGASSEKQEQAQALALAVHDIALKAGPDTANEVVSQLQASQRAQLALVLLGQGQVEEALSVSRDPAVVRRVAGLPTPLPKLDSTAVSQLCSGAVASGDPALVRQVLSAWVLVDGAAADLVQLVGGGGMLVQACCLLFRSCGEDGEDAAGTAMRLAEEAAWSGEISEQGWCSMASASCARVLVLLQEDQEQAGHVAATEQLLQLCELAADALQGSAACHMHVAHQLLFPGGDQQVQAAALLKSAMQLQTLAGIGGHSLAACYLEGAHQLLDAAGKRQGQAAEDLMSSVLQVWPRVMCFQRSWDTDRLHP